MTEIQTIQLAHLPPDLLVHVALYENLRNAHFLRQQLLEGNSEYEYALIDASVIISTTHILAAVFRAASDYVNKRLKSRNVHSEVVFSLSPNNNIAESFRRFGITDTTSNLLVIKLSTSPETAHESVRQHLMAAVEGTAVAFSDAVLNEMTDMARVKKIYKFNPQSRAMGKKEMDQFDAVGEEVERKELEVIALGLMALRGAN